MEQINLIQAGSTAVQRAFSSIINFSEYKKHDDNLNILVEKAEKILNTLGWVDLPLLMKKLNINSDTASRVLKCLKEKGLIMAENGI